MARYIFIFFILIKINKVLFAQAVNLEWSTYFISDDYDSRIYITDIAIDSLGYVYGVGLHNVHTFPYTSGAYDTTYNGGDRDAIAFKLSPDGKNLIYATYIGSSGNDGAFALEINKSGEAFIVGYTNGNDFPFTMGAYDTTYNGGMDVFLAKLSSDGASLLYSTYFGGNKDDANYIQSTSFDSSAPLDIKINTFDEVFITGYTKSDSFPVTIDAIQPILSGKSDVFVSKFKLSGLGTSDLLYSTYLGGNDMEGFSEVSSKGIGSITIAIDTFSNVYVTGVTLSSDFPLGTASTYDMSYNGQYEAFIFKLSTDGSNDYKGTYLGGSSDDFSYGIQVGALGDIFILGLTYSPDFPSTDGVIQTSLSGITDLFITRLSAELDSVIYSTYLGSTNREYFDPCHPLVLNVNDEVYISTSIINNPELPVTGIPLTSCTYDTVPYRENIYLAKLNSTGTKVLWASYIKGTDSDRGVSLALREKICGDSALYCVGNTQSQMFPTTPGVYKSGYVENGGGVVFKFSNTEPDNNPFISDSVIICKDTFLLNSGTSECKSWNSELYYYAWKLDDTIIYTDEFEYQYLYAGYQEIKVIEVCSTRINEYYMGSDTLYISILGDQTDYNITGDSITCLDEILKLSVPNNAISYRWKPASMISDNEDTFIAVYVSKSTLFKVNITDSLGCLHTDSFLVSVIDCDSTTDVLDNNNLFIPNSFSPNGDGINDELKVSGKGIDSYSFKVFNLLGKAVFESNDISINWDGKNSDNRIGNYVYIVTVTLLSGETINYHGNILLLR